MCHKDPETRITAAKALQHEFFSLENDNEMIIEESHEENRFKAYHDQQQLVFQNKNFEGNSLIIRNPMINGRTDTVKDSINSNGLITSFKSMSKPSQ